MLVLNVLHPSTSQQSRSDPSYKNTFTFSGFQNVEMKITKSQYDNILTVILSSELKIRDIPISQSTSLK